MVAKLIKDFGKYKLYSKRHGLKLVNSNMTQNHTTYGHTHKYGTKWLKRIGQAKNLIKWAESDRIPKFKGIEFLVCIKRLTEDKRKREKIQQIIDSKSNKDKQRYVNAQKGGI